jgi:hypothetical protein
MGLPGVETKEGAFGTQGHGYIADYIRSWKACWPDPPSDMPAGYPADVAQLGMDACQRFIELILEIEHNDQVLVRPENVLVEIRLDLLDSVVEGEILSFGHADLVVRVPEVRVVYVVDWKFGWAPVAPKTAGWQVLSYVVAAMQAENRVDDWAWCGKGLVRGVRNSDEWTLDIDEVEPWLSDIKSVISEAKKEGAPLQTGDHCQYCKARGLCDATVEEANIFATELTATSGASKAGVKKAIKPAVDRLPVEKVMPLLEILHRVEAACECLRSRARACLEQDSECLPGWRLQQRGGRRYCTVDAAKRATEGVLTEEEFWACCTPNLPALEERYASHFEVAAEGKRQFVEALGKDMNQAVNKELRRVKKKK